MASQVKNTDTRKNKNKKTAKTYKQRASVGQDFKFTLLKIFIGGCVVIVSVLGYLWYWLYRYESQSQNGAMTSYLADIKDQNWDKIYREDTRYFTELNSKETVISYLTYLYSDKDTSGIVFSYAGGTDNEAWYDAYYRSEKFAALELVKPENSDVWKVRTVPTNHEYSFDVIDSTPFRINSIPITEEYDYEDGQVPHGFEGLGLDDNLPIVRRYTISAFISEPEPVPEDEDSYMAVRDYSGNYMIIGPKPTTDQYNEFSSMIQTVAFAYVSFITGDGTYSNLSQYLYPNTVFANYVSAFDNQWYPDHDTAEYQNIQLTDIMPVGENAFIGVISFDYYVASSEASRTEEAMYQMFFVKNSSDEWKLSNLVIISSTDELAVTEDSTEAETEEVTEETEEASEEG